MRSRQQSHINRSRGTEHTSEKLVTDSEAALHDTRSVIGRKWNPVIIYYLLMESQLGFSDLKSRIDGISSKMLSESLSTLEEEGLVTRQVLNDDPVRVRYELTERGTDLEGIISEMVRWGTGNQGGN